MATAFMAENDYGTKDIKLDTYREGEARQWADKMLSEKHKVWVGRYSVRNAKWNWLPYDGTMPNIRIERFFTNKKRRKKNGKNICKKRKKVSARR